MRNLAFGLVFLSLFSHAYWNFLLKGANNKTIFIGLSKLAEVVIFLIPACYLLLGTTISLHLLWLVIVGAVITFFNYLFLTRAYAVGDLSLAYPISRSGIMFLPFLSWIAIDERMDAMGWMAVALILTGTLMMHMESFATESWKALWSSTRNAATGYAMLAAFTVAAYTLWGKIAVNSMPPFLYLYLYTVAIAIIYGAVLLMKFSISTIQTEWRLHKFQIAQVGFFNTFSYLLALIALTMSKATHVGGLRQLSVVVGVFLGYKYLHERITYPKLVGLLISILGGALIYFAK